MAVPIVPIRLGDVVRLKKPHACGENRWEITKLGMDIGLLCVGCGRRVRLERYEFDRRFRGFISRPGEQADAGVGAAEPAGRRSRSSDSHAAGGDATGPASESPAIGTPDGAGEDGMR